MLSDRSFELRYARHTERGQYKVFTCDRSIQGLALITKAHKLDEIENQDIILDPIYPVDNLLAEDVGIDERAQMDKDEPIGTEGTEIRDTDTHVSYEEGQHSHCEFHRVKTIVLTTKIHHRQSLNQHRKRKDQSYPLSRTRQGSETSERIKTECHFTTFTGLESQ